MPARLPRMSHNAMSTPLIALFSTGPLRQYDDTNDACQMSSICSGSLPTRNGLRYFSTAVSTTRGRCVKVAQPSPYKPGSLVVTLTTTRRIFAGAVRIVLISVIFSGDSFLSATADSGAAGCSKEPSGVVKSQGRLAPAPRLVHLSRSRRCMKVSLYGPNSPRTETLAHGAIDISIALLQGTRGRLSSNSAVRALNGEWQALRGMLAACSTRLTVNLRASGLFPPSLWGRVGVGGTQLLGSIAFTPPASAPPSRGGGGLVH